MSQLAIPAVTVRWSPLTAVRAAERIGAYRLEYWRAASDYATNVLGPAAGGASSQGRGGAAGADGAGAAGGAITTLVVHPPWTPEAVAGQAGTGKLP